VFCLKRYCFVPSVDCLASVLQDFPGGIGFGGYGFSKSATPLTPGSPLDEASPAPLVPPASITPSTPITTLTVASAGRPVTRSCPAYDPFMTSADPFSPFTTSPSPFRPLRAPSLPHLAPTSKSQPRIGPKTRLFEVGTSRLGILRFRGRIQPGFRANSTRVTVCFGLSPSLKHGLPKSGQA